ncbi:MAG: hypothetical protein GX312_03425 [Candidatus Phytoplasma sp.]|nr:hypothetical protein [Phytoplasma sp.]
MKKAKFYKHTKKNYSCLIFEDHLFDKDDEFLAKLLEIVKLFYKSDMTIICNFFDDNDKFANELFKVFGDKIETLFTFSRTKYYKRQVCLSETNMNEVLALAIKHEASPEIEASDRQGLALFQIGLNDNDGTFINFNTTTYNLDEIKTKISQILSD